MDNQLKDSDQMHSPVNSHETTPKNDSSSSNHDVQSQDSCETVTLKSNSSSTRLEDDNNGSIGCSSSIASLCDSSGESDNVITNDNMKSHSNIETFSTQATSEIMHRKVNSSLDNSNDFPSAIDSNATKPSYSRSSDISEKTQEFESFREPSSKRKQTSDGSSNVSSVTDSRKFIDLKISEDSSATSEVLSLDNDPSKNLTTCDDFNFPAEHLQALHRANEADALRYSASNQSKHSIEEQGADRSVTNNQSRPQLESNQADWTDLPSQSKAHSSEGKGIPKPNDGRPDSLIMASSVPNATRSQKRRVIPKKESYSSLSEYSSRSSSIDQLIEAAMSTPLHTQGTVVVEGDMVTFVADGINEMIKKNSSTSFNSSISRSSSSLSSSTSDWSNMSASANSRNTRSPSVLTGSPDDVPPIDPRAVLDLESHARRVASNVDHLMSSLARTLHKMSTCTEKCVDVYKEAVDTTCDSVDASIKSMYALMAKTEELSLSVKPVYQIKNQVKEIKRLLDLFEAQLAYDEA